MQNFPYEPMATVALVVDLGDVNATRLPEIAAGAGYHRRRCTAEACGRTGMRSAAGRVGRP